MTTPSSELYREIPLTLGQMVIIDVDNWQRFSAYKWQAHWHLRAKTYYVTRRDNTLPGRPTVWMHREVLGLGRSLKDDPRHGDHINHDGLDCRRESLRVASIYENAANKRMRRDNASGFKGVYFHHANRKWIAQVTKGNNQMYLGTYETPEEAHYAYQAAALKLHKQFANLG